MLNSLVMRPTSLLEPGLDIGNLAEALLFYQTTHLLLREGQITELTQAIGIDTLLALVEDGHGQIKVVRNIPATHASNTQGERIYDYVVVEALRSDGELRSPKEIITAAFLKATGRPGKSRRAAERFLRVGSVLDINEGQPEKEWISELARKDIEDPAYVRSAIGAVLTVLLGGSSPLDWQFEINRTPEGLRIKSNLDFAAITARHRSLFGGSHEISPAIIADFLHQATVDLVLAGRLKSELRSSKISSEILKLRLKGTFERAGLQNQGELQLFQDYVLDGRAIGEVIRSGARKFDEYLKFLDSTRKFKDWIANQPNDTQLLKQYIKDLSKESWLERLPAKYTRFAIFTSAGFAVDAVIPTGIGTGVGLTLGVVDTFLLDRMLGGWKPNQFIETSLKPFVDVKYID